MSAVLPRPRTIRRRVHTETHLDSRRDSSDLPWDPLAVTLHDLRTPLAVIAATTELLHISISQRGFEEDVTLLERIQRNTSWLTTLVDNLAADVELAVNSLTIEWSIVELQECLETSLMIVQTLFDQRRQHVQIAHSGEAKVRGDRRRIEQVLINLLMNASKYGDSHSEIQVNVDATDEWTRVEIQNWGPNIPVGEHEQIFERFVRGSNAKDSSSTGLGLGLHIVKTIVVRHGGQVGVVSSPEQGTLFWFTLPSVP